MAVALDRSVGLSWSRHRVAIECASELTRGMTVVDRLGVNSDAINADVWGAAAGESAGADILWTFDSAPVQGYAEDARWRARERERDREVGIERWTPGRNLLGERDLALSAAARRQSGALAPVGRRGAGRGETARLPDPAVDRLRRLPLVPRDGARVVRERRNRATG